MDKESYSLAMLIDEDSISHRTIKDIIDEASTQGNLGIRHVYTIDIRFVQQNKKRWGYATTVWENRRQQLLTANKCGISSKDGKWATIGHKTSNTSRTPSTYAVIWIEK